jgi:exosortase/archaeosortase family protein
LGQGKKPEGKDNGGHKSGGFRKEFFLFLVFFFILWLFSYILTRLLPGFTLAVQRLVAREVVYCIELLGYDVKWASEFGFVFRAPHGGGHLDIIPECTGLYTTIIYFSIIGAYPAAIKEKLLGLLIGVPAIHVLNLARMVFITVMLGYSSRLFHFFHGYLWQVVFVIFMLLLVIFWMGKIVRRGGGSG